MAKRVVDDNSLTGLADAIRAKTGKTDVLSFPTDFLTGVADAHAAGVQSEYDRFWDTYQYGGTRKTYQTAFYAWPDGAYNPKYPLGAGGFMNAFQGASITDTRVPIIVVGRGDGIFRNCAELIRILSLDLSGVTNVGNAFSGCSALVTLNMTGEIKMTGISLSDSPKLSKASIESILTALSTDTSGLSVTLSDVAVTTAFTDEEWAVLANTRPNWTIHLM